MYCIDIMDIEKAKKLYISQIEADQNTRFVRDVIKTDQYQNKMPMISIPQQTC